MKILDEHVAEISKTLNEIGVGVILSPEGKALGESLIFSHGDRGFLDKFKKAMLECLIQEYNWYVVPARPSTTVAFMNDTCHIYQTLLAILGPIYLAGSRTLPKVTLKDIVEVIETDPKINSLTLEGIASHFGRYNKAWGQMIKRQHAPLQRVVTRQLIWAVSQTFIRKLPEPLA